MWWSYDPVTNSPESTGYHTAEDTAYLCPCSCCLSTANRHLCRVIALSPSGHRTRRRKHRRRRITGTIPPSNRAGESWRSRGKGRWCLCDWRVGASGSGSTWFYSRTNLGGAFPLPGLWFPATFLEHLLLLIPNAKAKQGFTMERCHIVVFSLSHSEVWILKPEMVLLLLNSFSVLQGFALIFVLVDSDRLLRGFGLYWLTYDASAKRQCQPIQNWQVRLLMRGIKFRSWKINSILNRTGLLAIVMNVIILINLRILVLWIPNYKWTHVQL